MQHSMTGSNDAETTMARARLSAAMKANSTAESCVLTATGTAPALIAPRKAVGKSIVVVQAKKDALLRMNAEPAHEIGKPAHSFSELGIAVMAAIVDKSRLCAAPGAEVALDQVGRGIVSRRAFTAHPLSSRLRSAGRKLSRSAARPLYSSHAAVKQRQRFRAPPPSATIISPGSASGCAKNAPAAV